MTDIDNEINSTYFNTLPQRDLIGYVCVNCGWWVATLSQEDEHCRHTHVELPENMQPDAVSAAKVKALRARSRKGREDASTREA